MRRALLDVGLGHDADAIVNSLAYRMASGIVAALRCIRIFFLSVENKTLGHGSSLMRATGPDVQGGTSEKRRPQVTYASGIASSNGQSDQAAVCKPLRVFRKRKNNVRSAPSETTNCEARKLAEAQEEALRRVALEEMFVASRKRFLAIAYSVLRNRDDAEDAVQEAFLSAHRHIRSFEGRSALRTWLTRIVLNAALMLRRKRKPFAVTWVSEDGASHDDSWMENIPDAQPDPEMVYAERETLQFIDERLKRLKPDLRRAFTMAYYDDLSGAEASAMLGVSYGAFKARIFHAKRKLLDRTKRALVAPIRRTPASPSESWNRSGLRSLREAES